MSPIRFLARPMLAAGYISNGVDRLRRPEAAAASIGPLLNMARKRIDVPIDAPTLARATGAAQVAAGSLLAIGRFPRVSATILVGTYLLDTVGERIAADKATSKEDKRERTERTLIRTSMLGGALLASVDTAGKPGLWWRTQHAAEDLWSSVEGTSKQAMSALGVD
ncbi:DoxX family protein [Brevibacterium sandarakinum]|uniref:DoxX family protein n=1 Tax=Brevibacterium sandarakinum TaxID=629680 RepID=UPI00265289B6|nr:DoxX family membrane protein [Brevibacterium sandarakinum]MDN5635524.1 DoxX family membrane protein [Brevibacterium sp.]MDN5656134.1 DoxX family membrane protein [Brevibacterium sandarakinum]